MSEDKRVHEAMRVMEAHTGVEKGYRRAHARGIVFHATFTPSAEVRSLTTAEHFQGPSVHALVRLSNAAGSPYVPDRMSDRKGRVLGLAVRFELASGGLATWAATSLPVFFASTPEDFIQFVEAQRPDDTQGKPNLLRSLGYILTHPRSWAALKAVLSMKPASSFGHTAFNSLHAYYLVDAQGQRRAFRYRWVPLAGGATLSEEEAGKLPQQYLIDEIRERAGRERVGWKLMFQLAHPGDPVHDAARRWPESRPWIDAGQLLLDRLYENQRESEQFVFDPTGVVPGIELSEDPILRFRPKVYAESHLRRIQEKKPEPLPPDMRQ